MKHTEWKTLIPVSILHARFHFLSCLNSLLQNLPPPHPSGLPAADEALRHYGEQLRSRHFQGLAAVTPAGK